MTNKIDITNKVKAILEDGSKMNLYLDEIKVGKIILTNDGNHYEMADGFFFEDDKLYKEEEEIDYTKQYVEDCDKGWC